MHISMSVDKFIHPYNHHLEQEMNIFISLKSSLVCLPSPSVVPNLKIIGSPVPMTTNLGIK